MQLPASLVDVPASLVELPPSPVEVLPPSPESGVAASVVPPVVGVALAQPIAVAARIAKTDIEVKWFMSALSEERTRVARRLSQAYPLTFLRSAIKISMARSNSARMTALLKLRCSIFIH